MKLFLIGNTIYLPIDSWHKDVAPKYMICSISGALQSQTIYTEEEIKLKHATSKLDLKECEDLHQVINTWGIKLPITH